MAASEQNDIEHDNTADAWYNERQARIVSERARVEAQEITMRNAYAGIENQWQQLNAAEEEAHDSLDTRELVRIQSERQRLLGEADKLNNGLNANQQERQQIALAEHVSKLDFQSLYDIAPEKSKLFLEVFRSKLENNPAAVKKLLQADSVAGSKYTPCTNDYYAAIEQHMGWGPEERRFEFEDKTRETRREPRTQTLTPEQIGIAKDLGITSDEYAASIKNPFSQAHSATIELDGSDDFNSSTSKPMAVSLDEPKKPSVDTKRYKPGPQSMTLSPAQVKFCRDSGIDPKEYVKSALEVNSGRSNHQWYEQRLKSQGLA